MPGLRKKGGGYKIVPRGYDFLGPGNDVGFNVPRNHNDAVAKDHDIGYGTMLDRGLNPYITYNQWDEDFLRDLKPNGPYNAVHSTRRCTHFVPCRCTNVGGEESLHWKEVGRTIGITTNRYVIWQHATFSKAGTLGD